MAAAPRFSLTCEWSLFSLVLPSPTSPPHPDPGADHFLRPRRCSSVGLAFLGMVQGRPSDFVSQTIVTTFHAPAPLSVHFPLLLLSPSWPCNAQAIRALMLTALPFARSFRGAKLHIISTTTSFGARTVASRVEVSTPLSPSAQRHVPCVFSDCRRAQGARLRADGPRPRDADPDPDPRALPQIWDVTHGRLCVSGVHNKMAPKLPTPTPDSFHARL